MICANCGATNASGRKFCEECGSRLTAACTNCGAPLSATAKFCGECGTAVAVAVAAQGSPGLQPAPEASRAERRLVTVLFADLVGFTPFAEERDAEDVRDTLTRYFEAASEVIGRYGGTVEKFIGDAVMAVWGAPTAHEDDAERAVRAGLELLEVVPALGSSIQARAGILTGEAAVTVGAQNQGMVAGDLVNTASRLQSAAPPGWVLVGEATQRAASKAIRFEPVGEQQLKGKSSPVAAWRAASVVAEVGGRNRSDTLEAPFVGRDEDLRLLKDLFHATTRERRARLVSVVGPAGIGKTRLAWEFLKYVDGLVERVWWHDGRSPAYGDGITFWALGEMVRGRAGLLETDDEQTTRTKIAATVVTHVPDATDGEAIERALLSLLGFPSGMSSEQLFVAWRSFFEHLASESPVVMVFEDFHFADSGLVDFVDQLLDWSTTVPILVITLSRPEFIDRHPDWGARKRSFTSIFLEPLDAEAMRTLLLGLVPGLPDVAVQQIAARASGIPLYAVETVRMLLAEKRLRQEGDRYVPIGDLSNVAVPESLTALIAARLDALDPEERGLTQSAAVLGQSFTADGLSAVSGLDVERLAPHLRALVHRELLRMETDPRSPERGQYAFVQALIREVAYNTLSKPDRKRGHLAAARFFETLGTDELAGALAGHYLAAYRSAAPGDEADALASQARVALKAAADRAVALGSFAQAVAFLDQAIDVTQDESERAATRRTAAAAAESAANPVAAERYLGDAAEWYRAQGKVEAWASTAAQLGRVLISASKLEPALELMRGVLDEAGSQAGRPAEAELHAQVSRALMLQGNDAESVREADLALRAAEPIDLVPVTVDTLITKGTAMRSFVVREATALLYGALQLAITKGLVASEFRAANNLANVLYWEDPESAERIVIDRIPRARQLGQREWEVTLVRFAGISLTDSGRWNEWLPLLAAVEKGPLPVDAVVMYANIRAWIAMHQGDYEEGEALLRGVEPALETLSSPVATGWREFVRAEANLAAGDATKVFELCRIMVGRTPEFRVPAAVLCMRAAILTRDLDRLDEGIAMLNPEVDRGTVIDAMRTYCDAGRHGIQGDPSTAFRLASEAVDQARTSGRGWIAAAMTVEILPLLDVSSPRVQAFAEPARDLIVELGARPYLERLDAALASPQPAVNPTQTATPAAAPPPPVPSR